MAADAAAPDDSGTPGLSGEAFRRFAEGAGLLIWHADTAARCLYVNPAWSRFRGRAAAEEADSGWLDGLHPDDRPGHAAAMAAAGTSRDPFTVEFRLRRHDGCYRWVHCHAQPLVEAGEVKGYFGACFDISERKAAEEHAALALAEKETLLAEVYHRVRNNLQVMVSLIGLYGRAAHEACRPAFEALGQRVRAIALVQQHLHEAPHIASIDLAEYLDRLGHGLAQLRRTGRINIKVVVGRSALLPPRTANALGMIMAEIVAECLDATAESVACAITVTIPADADPVRVLIVSSGGTGQAAPASVPRLGPRLIAAYAAQAEITATGQATAEAPLELTLPADTTLRAP
ncbi:sensor histidine kinase [Methylobacterium oryzihabitans]|uniref:histidine kinase n=1 Tax=Methylobacterium oryzihabitans TaxID=2499852 RepID=A0A3S2VRX9_9HYPH|nr:PAS domain S-box protein [Methylobacterium oryzihabitans]RVU15778.1 PAS domain S-box protein [Methylobacterium oryzihabitans]